MKGFQFFRSRGAGERDDVVLNPSVPGVTQSRIVGRHEVIKTGVTGSKAAEVVSVIRLRSPEV